MKDIPVFATEAGVATLLLKKVPYTKTAYVIIHDSLSAHKLLEECCDFCRAVGAQQVLATGHTFLTQYPVYTAILTMQRSCDGFFVGSAVARLIRENETSEFRAMYNTHMMQVPNAEYLTNAQMVSLFQEGVCYYVYDAKMLIGIGIVRENKIDAVISLVPGQGKNIMGALVSCMNSDRVSLKVSSDNIPACRLYERLGFKAVGEREVWYQII